MITFTGPGAMALALLYALLGALGAVRETDVSKTFRNFQEALAVRDPLKIWPLLDRDSQNAAKQAAEVVRSAYGFAGPNNRATLISSFGLPGEVLSRLDGPGFVGAKPFLGKYRAVPVSRISEVRVDARLAAIWFREPDGVKERIQLKKQGEFWKVIAPMPPMPAFERP